MAGTGWIYYRYKIKEVCNRTVIYQPALARKSEGSIIALWSKNDMDSVNKNFCLAPDVRTVRPENEENYLNLPT